jgi:predicted tellurium resistance membrane protein TerC
MLRFEVHNVSHTFASTLQSSPFTDWPSMLATAAPVAERAVAAGELISIESLVSLLTLLALEVVLGIDNVIFIAILAGRLPPADQPRARTLGIGMAVITRILLLLSITWVMKLTYPIVSYGEWAFSGKQLILFLGGLFLIGKSTYEIHDKLEGAEHAPGGAGGRAALTSVVLQIMIVDIVFSLDSVITAVGMTPHVPIMIVAVLLAAGVMMVFAGPISDFVHRHPTMKMLALAFLILIGVMLVGEAFGQHVSKGYIYFAMAFSLGVELLNLRLRARAAPVPLRHSTLPE